MPFLEGFNQAFFPVLLQYLQQQRQMNERQQALEGLQQELTTTETIPAPTAQVPGTARSGFNPMTGGGTRLSAPPMTISGVPTQEQRQIGFDDPRAIQPLLNYYSQIGEPIGLNALMSLFQAQQPKVQFLNQEYGGVDVGKIYPTGRATVERLIEPDERLRKQAMAQPTELAKHQAELATIKAQNPNDPRIPQYEAVIKRLQIGVPGFRPLETGLGEFQIYDPKTGQFGVKTGEYKPAPSEIRQQMSQLNVNLQSIKDIREIGNRASITGAVVGRARKLGSRFFSDKDAQQLINKVGQLRTIIYGLSGKQINEAELEWLNKEILPRIEQPSENFEVTLDILDDWIRKRVGSLQEQYPSLGGQRGSGRTRFEVGGELFDIPENEVQEFLKEYPNATRK